MQNMHDGARRGRGEHEATVQLQGRLGAGAQGVRHTVVQR